MRKFLAVLVLISLASCASAGSLSVVCHAPTQGNGGSCAVPILGALSGNALWVHFVYVGPGAAGHDSLSALPGALVNWNHVVPDGTYTIRAYASNLKGAGCDSTIVQTIESAPWRINP